MTKEQIDTSLRIFVERRDATLHEDEATFDYSIKRLMDWLQTDQLAQQVLSSLLNNENFDIDQWWQKFSSSDNRQISDLFLPSNLDEELAVRYHIARSVASDPNRVFSFGFVFSKRKRGDAIEVFRSILLRPFVEELGNRMGRIAHIVTPQERALQAVPLSWLPREDEARIFLSHKTVDKSFVYRYYYALKELGFSPWLDEPDMPAGSNLEREVLRGFSHSCAAIFFITDNFKDEKFLGSEVDYAIRQKREKDKKFSIITLVYSETAPVPDLLSTYVYKPVKNDLEGFREIIRALPIEPGPMRWKRGISES